MSKVLITGCTGLVGSILWKGLLGSFELYGLDFQVDPSGAHVFKADITEPRQVNEAFGRISGLQYVVHLAGDARVDADWESAFRVNIGGTRNVYEAARLSGVRRVVFASSNHVTGAYEGFPPCLHTRPDLPRITTRDPIRPDSSYGVSKAACEALARMYFELYGLESICLRIGTVTADNDPTQAARTECTWLSHRDLVQLVTCSLTTDVRFGIYYGVSDNRRRFWDIADAERDLGYHPQDGFGREHDARA